MRKTLFVTLAALLVGIVPVCAQDNPAAPQPPAKPAENSGSDRATSGPSPAKPIIVVSAFVTTKEVVWPYDMKELQKQTVAELYAKVGKECEVAAEAPTGAHGRVYTLNGEVTSWRPGNRAKRMLVGMGSGRETADIHYWLTDESGEKAFDSKDTIRAEFWGNAYEGSVGQLAHPFADKIAGRIKGAKLK